MNRNIVIAGSLAQRPGNAGHTWVLLQYLLGFKRLGWNVLFLDRLEPEMCVDKQGSACPFDRSCNLDYFNVVMERFGISEACCLLYNKAERVFGRTRRQAREFVGSAELVLNVMGFFDDLDVLRRAKRKVFLDIDPGFPQMWRDTGLHDLFAGHHEFVTIGMNIGRPDCKIPTCGLSWIKTPQPVVLDEWPDTAADGSGRITSIATWRGPFGPVEYAGEVYGLRAHQFRRFATLPKCVNHPFELALEIHPAESADLVLLRDNGWRLVEPRQVCGDPAAYRSYIQQSAAELMIAKGMYVQSNSGWMSDRSLCYLASGKPVIAQDTGLESHYPLGEGLVTFRTFGEATDAVNAVLRDYAQHARAARALAVRYFDSDKVLRVLLDRLGVAA